jgi:hypothetical protein
MTSFYFSKKYCCFQGLQRRVIQYPVNHTVAKSAVIASYNGSSPVTASDNGKLPRLHGYHRLQQVTMAVDKLQRAVHVRLKADDSEKSAMSKLQVRLGERALSAAALSSGASRWRQHPTRLMREKERNSQKSVTWSISH